MWAGLFTVLSYSLVMGFASFLAGYVPLSFGLSRTQFRVISSIGTGLLVGTCLIIIIPEGIETLYSAQEADGSGTHHGRRQTKQGQATRNGQQQDGGHRSEPHAWVGLALVAGFILMYIIDELPKRASRSAYQRAKPRHISLANLARGPLAAADRHSRSNSDVLDDDPYEEYETEPAAAVSSRSSATTIGLVIHAAADGIALAASSFLAEASTGLVVFLALMVHKAPAAFGLTSVLLKHGFTKRQAKAHLLVFSLAAPVGALATYILVNVMAGGQIEGQQGTKFATGLLLLFSGGTFLYVAMHTMQDGGHGSANGAEDGAAPQVYSNGHSYAHAHARSYSHSSNQHHRYQQHAGSGGGGGGSQTASLGEFFLGIVGMLLPLLAQIGHAH